MASKLRLFGFPVSQPTRSVLMLCKSAGISYDFVLVDALQGHTRSADFRKINPAGLVPVIDDNGFILSESPAILQYIVDSRSLSEWQPRDAQTAAKINFWMHWHHSNSRKATRAVLIPHMFPPKHNGDEIRSNGFKELSKATTYLNDFLSVSGSKFLVNDTLTLADLLIVTEYDQLMPEAFNLFDFHPFPFVDKWVSEVRKAVPCYQEFYSPVVEAASRVRASKSS